MYWFLYTLKATGCARYPASPSPNTNFEPSSVNSRNCWTWKNPKYAIATRNMTRLIWLTRHTVGHHRSTLRKAWELWKVRTQNLLWMKYIYGHFNSTLSSKDYVCKTYFTIIILTRSPMNLNARYPCVQRNMMTPRVTCKPRPQITGRHCIWNIYSDISLKTLQCLFSLFSPRF